MEFENIKKGDYVCLIGLSGNYEETATVSYSGVPFRVDNLSYPFVVARPATDETKLVSFDLRVHHLTKSSRSYYNTFLNNSIHSGPYDVVCECPVCREGSFRLYHTSNVGPIYRCTVCKSIVNETLNDR